MTTSGYLLVQNLPLNAKSIHVSRDSTILRPDQSRVLLRPFARHGNPERWVRLDAQEVQRRDPPQI